MIKEFQELALDILFPKLCIKCSKEGSYICSNCELFMSENALICPVCSHSSFSGETHFNCFRGYQLNGLTSIWDYDGIVEQIIKYIKYAGKFDLTGELLDNFLEILKYDNLKRFSSFLSFLADDKTYITYVPMYKSKEKRRGFNQAKIIANELGKIFSKPVISLLDKTGDTKEQAKLNKEDRLLNVKNSFSLINTSIASPDRPGLSELILSKQDQDVFIKNILLVDDVFTTGATMKECCKILKKNNSRELGINKVWGFTLARTI